MLFVGEIGTPRPPDFLSQGNTPPFTCVIEYALTGTLWGGARMPRAACLMAVRIFEFRPVEGQEAHPEWALSDYCGACRVVAVDEQSARAYAARAFAKDSARGWAVKSPWQNPEVVRAVFVISGAQPLPPDGTVMMPAKGYPGFSLGPKARRRMREEDDDKS